jgi:hypothetical protein
MESESKQTKKALMARFILTVASPIKSGEPLGWKCSVAAIGCVLTVDQEGADSVVAEFTRITKVERG